MEENMTEKEQATALIEEYAKLQRIKTAEDRDSELEYQIKWEPWCWKSCWCCSTAFISTIP